MLLFVLTVVCTLVLACAVVVYVAFPHRGHDVPSAPWLGDLMRRGVARLPTLDNQAGTSTVDVADRSGEHASAEQHR